MNKLTARERNLMAERHAFKLVSNYFNSISARPLDFTFKGGNDKSTKSDALCLTDSEFNTTIKRHDSQLECRMQEPESALQETAFERLFQSNRKQATYHLPQWLAMIEYVSFTEEGEVLMMRLRLIHRDTIQEAVFEGFSREEDDFYPLENFLPLRVKNAPMMRKGQLTFDLIMTGLNYGTLKNEYTEIIG